MVAIHISTMVGDDRKLVVQLPPEIQPGQVEVIIQSAEMVSPDSARNIARSKLMAARALVTQFEALPVTVPLSVEERLRLGTLSPNARSSLDLINEDRGEW